MQITFFAVTKIPKDERGGNMWAKRVCGILFHGDGSNLSGLMIGRQLCVVSCMFFIARVVAFNIDPVAGESTMFGVSAKTNFMAICRLDCVHSASALQDWQ